MASRPRVPSLEKSGQPPTLLISPTLTSGFPTFSACRGCVVLGSSAFPWFTSVP